MGGFRRQAGRVARAAAIVVVLAVAVPALGQPGRGRSVTFTASFADPGSRFTGVDGCAPGYLSVAGSAVFSKPLEAVDTYTGCLSYDPSTQSITGETWDKQTGSLSGCGSGSFVMHQTDFHTSQMPYDPSSNSARMTLKWTVVPGSGTGAFAGASGSGTGYADFAPPSASSFPGVPNTGVYTGTVTCPHHT